MIQLGFSALFDFGKMEFANILLTLIVGVRGAFRDGKFGNCLNSFLNSNILQLFYMEWFGLVYFLW